MVIGKASGMNVDDCDVPMEYEKLVVLWRALATKSLFK
jgi:hypothetical protein